MKSTPILMCSEMVMATLQDLKTETRRVVKPQPASDHEIQYADHDTPEWRCPYGEKGDRLWVKETHEVTEVETLGSPGNVQWRVTTRFADGVSRQDALTLAQQVAFGARRKPRCRVMPAIFVPRWASRITLEITNIRVERVVSISVADCVAEGIQLAGRDTEEVRAAYRHLWDSLTFKRIT